MQVTILYFAVTRDLTGVSEERVSVPDGVAFVRDLPAFLEARHPTLAGRMGQVRLARNECFAEADEPIGDGDVIALIPPVAGG